MIHLARRPLDQLQRMRKIALLFVFPVALFFHATRSIDPDQRGVCCYLHILVSLLQVEVFRIASKVEKIYHIITFHPH
jgi:hypothetical protein